MSDLKQYRDQINEIDQELIRLFEERMHVVLNVGAYKLERGIPVLNEAREKEVIEKNVAMLKDPSLASVAARFFQYMMDLSKEVQEELIKSKE